ncbi:hypothetical protein DWB61_04200 [Ancylomarina euxinus]|uniref:DUF4493 domain-containing protein n=1 Tax=Ancylomarina euxinus TaxID=2283627 RepID=A0A425Y540_9BACT|nr:hypothetical protein [Ancylomarina euxinus]MCZ4694385.1 hypothetical protein [Ancylomarina euxinus]MUP14284.1 hypothetical protein [Ancylomarina euxinus]RRG23602.1 hypothetical protein DWB61_04200 [Ancylomarina euxinus]
MRKLLFIVAVITTMFTGCSKNKDAEVKPEAMLNKVTFNTNSLTSEISNTKTGIVLPVYEYLLFKQDGTFVKTIQFTSAIADELPAGDYTVTLIGHDLTDGAAMSAGSEYINCSWEMNGARASTTGFFKGKVDFTVTDNIINAVTVDLKRISAAIAYNFTDLEGTRALCIEIQNMPTSYWMGTRAADGAAVYNSFPLSNKTSQLLVPNIVDNTPYLATVKVSVYNAEANTIIKIRTINDVPLAPNCTTTISGEILKDETTTKNSPFNITLDETWGDPITVNF